MVVVVVVVTVIVRLMAKRSEPLRSWIDGGTTGRPSRRRSLFCCLSLSTTLSLLLFDLLELPRSLLLECCPVPLSLSFFLLLESLSLSSLLWLLMRFWSLSLSLPLSFSLSLSLFLSLSLSRSLSLSLTLSLSLFLSLSCPLSLWRSSDTDLVWTPLPEELWDREASGLLCRLFFLFWLLLLLLLLPLTSFPLLCPCSFSLLLSLPPSFSFLLFFLLSSLSPAFLSLLLCRSRSLELLEDLWLLLPCSTEGITGEEGGEEGGWDGGGRGWGERAVAAGKERYLSLRLLTSFLLRSSTPTTGSSSGSISGSQLPSARTDTKLSPSRTLRMRSGFGTKKEVLGEFRRTISSAGFLLLPSLSATPTISPSSISEWSESVLSLCALVLVLQSTLLLRGS